MGAKAGSQGQAGIKAQVSMSGGEELGGSIVVRWDEPCVPSPPGHVRGCGYITPYQCIKTKSGAETTGRLEKNMLLSDLHVIREWNTAHIAFVLHLSMVGLDVTTPP